MTSVLTKGIRILTVAPIMALVLLIGCIFHGNAYASRLDIVMAIVFLTVLPLLSYPLQPVTPYFKDKGRDGQRNLAIIFAVIGYIGGTIYCFCSMASAGMIRIFLTYMASGLLIMLSTAVIHVKASGHACGITGPMILAFLNGISFWWVFILLYIVVMIVSVSMKRHSVIEFILGGIIPIAVSVIITYAVG